MDLDKKVLLCLEKENKSFLVDETVSCLDKCRHGAILEELQAVLTRQLTC